MLVDSISHGLQFFINFTIFALILSKKSRYILQPSRVQAVSGGAATQPHNLLTKLSTPDSEACTLTSTSTLCSRSSTRLVTTADIRTDKDSEINSGNSGGNAIGASSIKAAERPQMENSRFQTVEASTKGQSPLKTTVTTGNNGAATKKPARHTESHKGEAKVSNADEKCDRPKAAESGERKQLTKKDYIQK